MSFELRERSVVAAEAIERLRVGLARLRRAYDYARDLDRDPWDFAVEIQAMSDDGLTNSDFRWLLCKGYVEHAGEVTPLGEDRRVFRKLGKLNFCRRACFVLTAEGAAFLGGLSGAPAATAAANGHAADPAPRAIGRPHWNKDRMELRLGGLIVKRYKVPAPNQETILATFEEEGWPDRIDDPIPPRHDQDAKRRLHDTINSLNRNQKNPLIHFLGDGSGQGVRWEPNRPSESGNGRGSGNGRAVLSSPPPLWAEPRGGRLPTG